jgi:hypothetical protein
MAEPATSESELRADSKMAGSEGRLDWESPRGYP